MSENLLIFPTVHCIIVFVRNSAEVFGDYLKKGISSTPSSGILFFPQKIMHIPSGRICEAAGILSSFADLGRKEKGSRKMSQSGRSLEIGAHQPGSRNFNKLWNEVILMSRQSSEKRRGETSNVMNLRQGAPRYRYLVLLHYANGLSTVCTFEVNVDVCNICIGYCKNML